MDSFFVDDSDPTADFLAREQAALGADAALFGNPITSAAAAPGPAADPLDPIALADAAVAAAAAAVPVPATTPPAAVPLFGFDAPAAAPAAPAEDLFFGAAAGAPAPAPAPAAPGFGFEAAVAAFPESGGSVFAQPDPAASVFVPEIDPEPIREWRERFNATVADRDARSRDKHEQILAQAKESLERFYAEYSEKKAKSISRNKELEKTLIAARDDSTSGTIWERVVKQIETTQAAKDKKDDKKDKKNKGPADASAQKPKGRDTARFKQLLLSLRSDKNAPTVA